MFKILQVITRFSYNYYILNSENCEEKSEPNRFEQSPEQSIMCLSWEPGKVLHRALHRSRSISEQGHSNPGTVRYKKHNRR